MENSFVELLKIGGPYVVAAGSAVWAFFLTRQSRSDKTEDSLLANVYTKEDARADIGAERNRYEKLMADQEDRHRREISSLIETHKYQITSMETRANLDISNLNAEITDLKKRVATVESENYDLRIENKALKGMKV